MQGNQLRDKYVNSFFSAIAFRFLLQIKIKRATVIKTPPQLCNNDLILPRKQNESQRYYFSANFFNQSFVSSSSSGAISNLNGASNNRTFSHSIV